MSSSVLFSVGFPFVLGLIMFGLGTSLTRADFAQVRKNPKALAVGLFIQLLIGPLIALLVIQMFSLSGSLAFGLLLLAAVPGGSTSNLFSHLAGGDVALNVSLTAVNSFLGLVSIPTAIYLFSSLYLGAASAATIPYQKIIETIVIVLFPVLLGMVLRNRNEPLALKMEPWVQRLAFGFIFLLVVIGLSNERDLIMNGGGKVLWAVIVFNLLNLLVAYGGSLIAGLGRRQAIAITFEVGIHNCTLAMGMAMSPLLFNDSQMAIPAIFYSIFMQFSAGFLIRYFRTSGQGIGSSFS